MDWGNRALLVRQHTGPSLTEAALTALLSIDVAGTTAAAPIEPTKLRLVS